MPTPTGNENLSGALTLGQSICWDETHGYVMGADMNPDTDCSGFIGYCLSQNGFNVPRRWDTTTMIPTLQSYPGFTEIIWNPSTPLIHGDILVYDEGGGANGHTFFYAENVIGYTSNDPDLGDGTTGLLTRARIEASSNRGRPQTGDQDNGYGMHPEVWVHPYSAPSTSHVWHLFRWNQSPIPGDIPAWLYSKFNKKRRYKDYDFDY